MGGINSNAKLNNYSLMTKITIAIIVIMITVILRLTCLHRLTLLCGDQTKCYLHAFTYSASPY